MRFFASLCQHFIPRLTDRAGEVEDAPVHLIRPTLAECTGSRNVCLCLCLRAGGRGYCVCRVRFVEMVRARASGSACLMCAALAEERLGKCEDLRTEVEGVVLWKLKRSCSFLYNAVRSVQTTQRCHVGFACICPAVVVMNFSVLTWQIRLCCCCVLTH